MRMRVILGKFLLRFGSFIKSLALIAMKPKDLVEFNKLTYLKNEAISKFSQEKLINIGLKPEEVNLLEKIPLKSGKLLLLGVGGGREAIALSKLGFDVTGVDFVKQMVEKTIENGEKRGLIIEGVVQEISNVDLPEDSFQIIWLSSGTYSSIPTKKKRITMLKNLGRIIKKDGYFLCQFHWHQNIKISSLKKRRMKTLAALFFGNFQHEKGDTLWGNNEFLHLFSTESSIRTEFEEGGFKVIEILLPESGVLGTALLYKKK